MLEINTSVFKINKKYCNNLCYLVIKFQTHNLRDLYCNEVHRIESWMFTIIISLIQLLCIHLAALN